MLYITELILVVEIDEKGHNAETQIIKKKTERTRKAWLPLFRINPDKIDFNDFEEFGRVSTYIAETIKKQTEESAKKSLIYVLSKRLLELESKSNHSIKSKYLEWTVKKILPTL